MRGTPPCSRDQTAGPQAYEVVGPRGHPPWSLVWHSSQEGGTRQAAGGRFQRALPPALRVGHAPHSSAAPAAYPKGSKSQPSTSTRGGRSLFVGRDDGIGRGRVLLGSREGRRRCLNLDRREPWVIVGTLMIGVGLWLVGAYSWGVINVIGEADRSWIFWGLALVAIGIPALGAGARLVVWGRSLRRS